MFPRKSLVVSGLALFVFATSGRTAHTQNVVADPGFEIAAQGNYNAVDNPSLGDGGWTVTQGFASVFANDQYAHTGNQSFAFRSGGGGTTVEQTLPTIAGTDYDLSFYAYATNQPNVFSMSFDGTTIYDPSGGLPYTGNGTLGYAQYTFTNLLASTNSTALSFTSGTSAELDDVSVTPSVITATPEPGTYALLASLALTGIAFRRRVR